MTEAILLNGFLSAFIVATAGGAGWLAYRCSQHWQDPWRTLAGLPLYVLGIWATVSVVELIRHSVLPALWFVELYGWALLSIVYMGILFSARQRYRQERAGVR